MTALGPGAVAPGEIAITALPWFNLSDRRYVAPSHASIPGTARSPRNPKMDSEWNGARYASRSDNVPPVSDCGLVPRNCVGDDAYTSRIVSLNWRTLAKPEANAICVIGIEVVSINVRAVWARCARASASGPAPSSVVNRRLIWRSL